MQGWQQRGADTEHQHPAGLLCSPVGGMCRGAPHPQVPLTAATEVLWEGMLSPGEFILVLSRLIGGKGVIRACFAIHFPRLLVSYVSYPVSYDKSLNCYREHSEGRVLELCVPASCPPAGRDHAHGSVWHEDTRGSCRHRGTAQVLSCCPAQPSISSHRGRWQNP